MNKKVIFDNTCAQWDMQDVNIYNNMFLRALENKLKMTINFRGFITLVDVCDGIGRPYSYSDFWQLAKTAWFDPDEFNIMDAVEIKGGE